MVGYRKWSHAPSHAPRYTGPIYEKLNAVLRALSGNPLLKKRCEELTRGNTYATTIHAVSSCVLKLSKLAMATKVYRGLQGAALPTGFFEPNEYGVCGGIEFGFTSTSLAKAEALAYATSVAQGKGSASCPTLLELDQASHLLQAHTDGSSVPHLPPDPFARA